VSDFEVKHSILYRKLRMEDGFVIFRYFVPKDSRLGLLRVYHDEQCHVGGEKTLHKVREQFWFPRMTSFVKKYIAHCLVCVMTKRPSGPKQGLLHSIDKTPAPFHTVHADCLGPFKVTTEGFKHILLLIDAFTKYVLLIPLRTLTGSEMVSALETHLLLFGTPTRMKSERGTNFTDRKVVACQNATIRLAGVGGPRDPTYARGTIRSLLKDLVSKTKRTAHDDATRPPCRNLFRDAHFYMGSA
jgi:hypothetical protein